MTERMKVLDMLEKGTITASEATELLKSLDGQPPPIFHSPSPPPPPPHPETHDIPDLGWMSSLKNAFENFGGWSNHEEHVTITAGVDSFIKELYVRGKNDEVTIEPHEGNELIADITYIIKKGTDCDTSFGFTSDDGVFYLKYDDNAFQSVGARLRIPKDVSVDNLKLISSNAEVRAKDITTKAIKLETKNAEVIADNVNCETMFCDTKNAEIQLEDITANNIDSKTKNAEIKFDNVKAYEARVYTANAMIEIIECDLQVINAKTSNADMHLINPVATNPDAVIKLEAETSNGNIKLKLPDVERKYKIRASTSNGNIINELENLIYRVNEKNYVEAVSPEYDNVDNKTKINLQTSNANIKIKK